MAACDVRAVREGIETNLQAITGLRTTSIVPDNVSPPVAIVAFPESINYDDTFGRGADRLSVLVHVLVGKVSDRAANTALDAYLSGGEGGIKAAIEADITLDGAARTCRVVEAETNVMVVGAQEYLAATFTVDVLT